jgi:hypothetical protein
VIFFGLLSGAFSLAVVALLLRKRIESLEHRVIRLEAISEGKATGK